MNLLILLSIYFSNAEGLKGCEDSALSQTVRSVMESTHPLLRKYPTLNILKEFPALQTGKPINLEAVARSGWSGNGGDTDNLKDNIWYLGDAPVPYCIQRSNNYALSQENVSQLVRDGIDTWREFFKKYDLLDRELGTDKLKFADGKPRRFSSQFVEVNCQELEKNDHQLVFLFGEENTLVDLYRDLATENAYGLALRTGYDHETFRNSGFVWITKELRSPEEIRHILLHELGHVFGMKHDSVYIMDSDVVDHVTLTRRSGQRRNLGRIESPFWRYKFNEGEVIFLPPKLRFRGPSRQMCSQTMRANFRMPEGLRSWMKVDKDGCYTVKMRVKKVEGPRSFSIALSIRSGEKSLELLGNFSSTRTRPRDSMYPGVFTEATFDAPWSQGNTKSILARLALGNRFDLPAKGYFTTSDGLQLPAQVDFEKGVKIEMFLPSGEWWIAD